MLNLCEELLGARHDFLELRLSQIWAHQHGNNAGQYLRTNLINSKILAWPLVDLQNKHAHLRVVVFLSAPYPLKTFENTLFHCIGIYAILQCLDSLKHLDSHLVVLGFFQDLEDPWNGVGLEVLVLQWLEKLHYLVQGK